MGEILNALSTKKHFIVYIQESGQIVIGTDDLQDIARQEWFRQMMSKTNAHLYTAPAPVQPAPAPAPQPVQPQPQPVQQPTPGPQPQQTQQAQQLPESFMDVPPNAMRQDMWQAMSAEQQHAWAQKYGIQLK